MIHFSAVYLNKPLEEKVNISNIDIKNLYYITDFSGLWFSHLKKREGQGKY